MLIDMEKTESIEKDILVEGLAKGKSIETGIKDEI